MHTAHEPTIADLLPVLTVVRSDEHDGLHPYTWDGGLRWWAPTIGPTCVVLLFELDRHGLGIFSTTYTIDAAMLASRIGVHGAVLRKALIRLARFGLIRIVAGDLIELPRRLPALRSHQLDRLYPDAVREYIDRYGDDL